MPTHVSNNIRLGAVISNAVLCICVCTPLVIYFLHGFTYMSSSVMIQKRYPKILKHIAIGVLFWLGISLPILVTDWAELDEIKGRNKEIIRRLNQCIYPCFSHGIFVATTWRFWHIYFDLKYSSSQKNSEWKYHLDPNLVQHNFWLTHKKNYGSVDYTRKFAYIIYIILTISVIINYQFVVMDPIYFIYIGHAWSSTSAGIIGTIALILCWKVPEYSDHFFIKYEMRIISLFLLSTIALGFISLPSVFFLSSAIVMVWCGFLGSVVFFGMAALSFWWIPRKIRLKELEIKIQNLELSSTNSKSETIATGGTNLENNNSIHNIVRRLSVGNHSHVNINVQNKHKSYKLIDILSEARSFKIFMQHLAQEFSTESLLCFVEIIQYKYAMKKRFDRINDTYVTDEMNVAIGCPLHEIVPMSLIIKQGFEYDLSKYKHNDDPSKLINEAKKVCLKLYNKYISVGSELEVNISYEMRNLLIDLMNSKSFFMESNINANELFCIFDKVATCMFTLMHGSFRRFRQTPQFDIACKEVDKYL